LLEQLHHLPYDHWIAVCEFEGRPFAAFRSFSGEETAPEIEERFINEPVQVQAESSVVPVSP